MNQFATAGNNPAATGYFNYYVDYNKRQAQRNEDATSSTTVIEMSDMQYFALTQSSLYAV